MRKFRWLQPAIFSAFLFSITTANTNAETSLADEIIYIQARAIHNSQVFWGSNLKGKKSGVQLSNDEKTEAIGCFVLTHQPLQMFGDSPFGRLFSCPSTKSNYLVFMSKKTIDEMSNEIGDKAIEAYILAKQSNDTAAMNSLILLVGPKIDEIATTIMNARSRKSHSFP